MRNLNSKLVMDFISEQGYDSIEKTYVAYTPLEKYVCIAVAESYDNETEENSAQLAVEAVLTAFETTAGIYTVCQRADFAAQYTQSVKGEHNGACIGLYKNALCILRQHKTLYLI